MALLGCAYASPFLQYTPEVVAERARFQQLYNAAAAAAAAAPDPVNSARQFHYQAPVASHYQPATTTYTGKWNGPVAATVPAGLPGAGSQVQDTADVASARNAFFNAFKAQVAATTGPKATYNQWAQPAPAYNQQPTTQKWTGPLATDTPAGLHGQVIPVGDTADVAAARNAFFASYNKALAATQAAPKTPVYQHQAATFSTNAIQQPIAKWTGPVAATVPAGLPGSVSQVGPTADVAAATNAFYQAYSAAVAATTGQRF